MTEYVVIFQQVVGMERRRNKRGQFVFTEPSIRFERLIAPPDENGCRVWLGVITEGYGRFFKDATHGMVWAHRFAWEQKHGPIPPSLTVDHLCRVRACVTTEHMEIVTNKVNILRGDSPSARHARKDACSNGHPFDLLNTRIDRSGRICRECERRRCRDKRSRKRDLL